MQHSKQLLQTTDFLFSLTLFISRKILRRSLIQGVNKAPTITLHTPFTIGQFVSLAGQRAVQCLTYPAAMTGLSTHIFPPFLVNTLPPTDDR